jgi:predicted nucleic acid-binding protein
MPLQFWDTSALLPLVVAQPPFSAQTRRLFRRRSTRAVAFLARIECRSAIERLAREGALGSTARGRCLSRLDRLLAAFDVVAFSPAVEQGAIESLARHPIRSLDALQLACALELVQASLPAIEVVCCDRGLGNAVLGEGLRLAIAP